MRRLLLHGSAKHLLGSEPFPEKQVFRGPSYSDANTFVDSLCILPDLIRPLNVGTNVEHLKQPSTDAREGDRKRLADLARLPSVPSGLAKRARIVLLAADGMPKA